MTWAPLSAAKRMPSATLATLPKPCFESTLMGISVAQYARPAAPTPLFVVCAIVPATCVPWPWSSAASRVVVDEVPPALAPRAGQIGPAREGPLVEAGDARVDDGDGHALPARVVPRGLGADALEVPLLALVERIVRHERGAVERHRLGVLDARVVRQRVEDARPRAAGSTSATSSLSCVVLHALFGCMAMPVRARRGRRRRRRSRRRAGRPRSRRGSVVGAHRLVAERRAGGWRRAR